MWGARDPKAEDPRMSNVPNRATFEKAYAGTAPWDIGKPQEPLAIIPRVSLQVLYGPPQLLPPAPRGDSDRLHRPVSPQRTARPRALAAGPDHSPVVPRGDLRPLGG